MTENKENLILPPADVDENAPAILFYKQTHPNDWREWVAKHRSYHMNEIDQSVKRGKLNITTAEEARKEIVKSHGY